MKTFLHDNSLPSLPVPTLESTCAAILKLVAPLTSSSEFAATKRSVAEFLEDGSGSLLQNALLEHKSSLRHNASWLRPFWDAMYTRWRDPLPLHLNYFQEYDTGLWGDADALPNIVRALALTFRRLGTGELEPEPTKTGFLSMDQAASCAYTRIPGRNEDALLPVDLASGQTIAVVRNGRWFTVSLWREDGKLASTASIRVTFEAIKKYAPALPPHPPVGALTTLPRELAADARDDLLLNLQNSLSLTALERSLFVVCLDEAHSPQEDLGLDLMGGDAASRWFDKSLQIIATDNGGLGANFEHAGCDAGIWLYLFTKADEIIRGKTSDSGEATPLPCTPLKWNIPESASGKLKAAREDFAAKMAESRFACRSFSFLGQKKLRSLNTSPDAFLQMCFQAAQYAVFGKLRSSYEAVAARSFYQGRTECARGCSQEALEFAQGMREKASPEKMAELYRTAEKEHVARLGICRKGLGAERHVAGLQAMFELRGKELGLDSEPALFTDAGWRLLKHDALSTSGIGAPFIRWFGFPPVARDGFGVGYAPGADRAGVAVTRFLDNPHTPEAFLDAFSQASSALLSALEKQGQNASSA